MQVELRRTAAPHDLDVAPQDALRMTRTERLHRRFLGGESPGKMDCRDTPPPAVGHFGVGENAVDESIAIAFDGRGDAGNVGGVQAKANDVRHTSSDFRVQIDFSFGYTLSTA